MKVSMLCIGTELTTGAVNETNSSILASGLEPYGHEIESIVVVPDDLAVILANMQYLTDHYEYIFVSGGLGNTFDDITREAVSIYTGLPLEKSLDLPEKMAYKISGAEVFWNRVGLAPGQIVHFGTKRIILLPGVPAEFDYLLPLTLKSLFPEGSGMWVSYYHLLLKFEREVEAGLPKDLLNDPAISTTILGLDSEVLLILKSTNSKRAVSWDRYLKKIYKDCMYYSGKKKTNFETELVHILAARNQTVCFAESCTGGLVSSRISALPGVSKVYKGSVIVYSNESKKTLCNFDGDPVSGEASLKLATSSRDTFNVDWSVGVVCYAGPSGDKVGQAYISISGPNVEQTFEKQFKGNRAYIQKRAASFALARLLEALMKP